MRITRILTFSLIILPAVAGAAYAFGYVLSLFICAAWNFIGRLTNA